MLPVVGVLLLCGDHIVGLGQAEPDVLHHRRVVVQRPKGTYRVDAVWHRGSLRGTIDQIPLTVKRKRWRPGLNRRKNHATMCVAARGRANESPHEGPPGQHESY